ncbi:MAG: amidohydrolase [Candidatus Bathyarchaeia archaeon]
MSLKDLKNRVLDAIDNAADDIIEIGDSLWSTPELGYKEFKSSELVEKAYEDYGWEYENEIAITGSKAYIKNRGRGPVIGVIGELDALRVPDHPDSDDETGAVHACGHHAQTTSMLGAGIGLSESGVIDELKGNVAMVTVPAEEYLELYFRNSLRDKGEIEFFGGKQEFIHQGALDDVDISLGTHAASLEEGELVVGGSSNGFIGKLIRYKGKEAHAGAAPHKGVNALNAAMLGLMGIHAQRETFKDEDAIRVHPIITKGGEIVNNVPSDVQMESYVRGRTIDAILDANKKVNRALRAGAEAVGGEVDINDIPGYMPLIYNEELNDLLDDNCKSLVGESKVIYGGHGTGSTDLGDISCIMPTSRIRMGGVSGSGHSRSYKILNKELLYVTSSKALALTCIDLLYNNAEKGKAIIDDFTPRISREEYTRYMHILVE